MWQGAIILYVFLVEVINAKKRKLIWVRYEKKDNENELYSPKNSPKYYINYHRIQILLLRRNHWVSRFIYSYDTF